mgnify:CR=1 FL=1
MKQEALVTTFILSLCISSAVVAKREVIAITPHMEPEALIMEIQSILLHLTRLSPGDEAVLIDGYTLETIGKFIVPEGKIYSSPKARLNANRAVIANLVRFTEQGDPSNKPNAVLLPQLLRHIAVNLSSDKPLAVLVVGSPFYIDPVNQSFSMTGSRYPADNHLIASRAETPYGTKNQQDLLSNIRIHLKYESESIFASTSYRYNIERFWTLYTTEQGGELVTFTADMPTALSRLENTAPAPKVAYELTPIRTERALIDSELKQQSIFERSLSNIVLSDEELLYAQNVQIGLSWDCGNCDLDLYVRPNDDAEIIYFDRVETKEGFYEKDFENTARLTKGYETISFSVPINLKELKIATNFFSGTAYNGIEAELRITVNGKTYARKVRFNDVLGNKGKGVIASFDHPESLTTDTQMFSIDDFFGF